MPSIPPIFNLQSCSLILPLQRGKFYSPHNFTNCPALQKNLNIEINYINLTDFTKYNTNVFAHRTIIGSSPVFLIKAFFDENNITNTFFEIIQRIIKENVPEFFNIYLPVSPQIGLTRLFIRNFIKENKLPKNIKFYLYSKHNFRKITYIKIKNIKKKEKISPCSA